jgi:hypothetical protein
LYVQKIITGQAAAVDQGGSGILISRQLAAAAYL